MACGSAHHWARWLQALDIEVRLLPPRYVRAYVRRNKTDAADAAALLEACCALANKLARIAYACLRDQLPYGANSSTGRKSLRQSFAMADA